MPSVKKAKAHMQDAVVTHAQNVVADSPRGAPITVLDTPEVEAYIEKFDALPPRYTVIQGADAGIGGACGVAPCALDDAPVGSKVVIGKNDEGQKVARLTTPSDHMVLPPDDVASTLPIGAKIRKRMESVFEATQLNATIDKPAYTCSTAREAVLKFRTHFATE